MSTPDQTKFCLNCSEPLGGSFCSACGQSTSVGKIRFKETIMDFFSASFALEGPLMRTLQLLITNPGIMLRGFLAGERKKYYKPVAFFIMLTAVYLILRSWLDYNPLNERMQATGGDLSNEKIGLMREAGIISPIYSE